MNWCACVCASVYMCVCVLKTNVSSFSVVWGKKEASELFRSSSKGLSQKTKLQVFLRLPCQRALRQCPLWACPPWCDSVSSQHCREWGCAPVQRLSHPDTCHSCRQWVYTQGKKIAFHFQETIVSLTSHGTRDIWPFLSGPGTWGGRSSWAFSLGKTLGCTAYSRRVTRPFSPVSVLLGGFILR